MQVRAKDALYVICYMLYVVCYMLYVICYVLYVPNGQSFDAHATKGAYARVQFKAAWNCVAETTQLNF